MATRIHSQQNILGMDCFYIEVNGPGTINLELDLNKELTGDESDGVQLLLYDYLGSKRYKCSVSSLQDGCAFSYSMTADDRSGQYFACVYSSEMATDFRIPLPRLPANCLWL